MAASGDFFDELVGAIDRSFPPFPPLATQRCARDALQDWRDTHRSAIEQALADQRRLLEARKASLARWNADDRSAFQWAFGTTDESARQDAYSASVQKPHRKGHLNASLDHRGGSEACSLGIEKTVSNAPPIG